MNIMLTIQVNYSEFGDDRTLYEEKGDHDNIKDDENKC